MLTKMYSLLQLLHGFEVLLEKFPGFVGPLHQVLSICDKHNWVHHMFVVKKYANDPTGGITVDGLNDVIDSVTNLLASLSWLHLLKPCNEQFRVNNLTSLLNASSE